MLNISRAKRYKLECRTGDDSLFLYFHYLPREADTIAFTWIDIDIGIAILSHFQLIVDNILAIVHTQADGPFPLGKDS